MTRGCYRAVLCAWLFHYAYGSGRSVDAMPAGRRDVSQLQNVPRQNNVAELCLIDTDVTYIDTSNVYVDVNGTDGPVDLGMAVATWRDKSAYIHCAVHVAESGLAQGLRFHAGYQLLLMNFIQLRQLDHTQLIELFAGSPIGYWDDFLLRRKLSLTINEAQLYNIRPSPNDTAQTLDNPYIYIQVTGRVVRIDWFETIDSQSYQVRLDPDLNPHHAVMVKREADALHTLDHTSGVNQYPRNDDSFNDYPAEAEAEAEEADIQTYKAEVASQTITYGPNSFYQTYGPRPVYLQSFDEPSRYLCAGLAAAIGVVQARPGPIGTRRFQKIVRVALHSLNIDLFLRRRAPEVPGKYRFVKPELGAVKLWLTNINAPNGLPSPLLGQSYMLNVHPISNPLRRYAIELRKHPGYYLAISGSDVITKHCTTGYAACGDDTQFVVYNA